MRRNSALPEVSQPASDELLHEVEDYPGGPVLQIWRDADVVLIDHDGWRFSLHLGDGLIGYAGGSPAPVDAADMALTVERVLLPLYVLFEEPHAIGLHGSAVAVDGRAYIFIGRSGAGKSTTAYELMRRGATLVADDMSVVDVDCGLAFGAAPTIRLWKDSVEVADALDDRPVTERTTKRWFRFDATAGCAGCVPIGGVVLLDPDDDRAAARPSLEETSQRDALLALLEQTFDFSNPDNDWLTRRFRNASRLIKEYPSFRFSYRKSASGEPTHVEPLLDAISKASCP